MRRRLPRLKKKKKSRKKKKDKKGKGEDRRVDRKVKVRVKGLCGSNEPSRATIPPSASGVEFERMEKDAWALHGLEWREFSTWLAGGCGTAWFSFSTALEPIFRIASSTFLKFVSRFCSVEFETNLPCALTRLMLKNCINNFDDEQNKMSKVN